MDFFSRVETKVYSLFFHATNCRAPKRTHILSACVSAVSSFCSNGHLIRRRSRSLRRTKARAKFLTCLSSLRRKSLEGLLRGWLAAGTLAASQPSIRQGSKRNWKAAGVQNSFRDPLYYYELLLVSGKCECTDTGTICARNNIEAGSGKFMYGRMCARVEKHRDWGARAHSEYI